MKFYATVTCKRIIEVDEPTFEQAQVAVDQQISTLLPERDAWHPQINISAVRGIGNDRYYVYHQEATPYLVREQQQEGRPGPDDPIIRSFEAREDAQHYARSTNGVQRELDRRYGRWTQHASEH